MPMELLRTFQRFKQISMPRVLGNTTIGEYVALDHLRQHEEAHPQSQGIYVSELASDIRMSPPGASRLLRTLEAKGLLERIVDAQSRRNTYIRLTPSGRAVLAGIKRRMADFHGRVFEAMGEEAIAELSALLAKLAACMEDEAKHFIEDGEEPCSKS